MNKIKVAIIEHDIDWLKTISNLLEKDGNITIITTARCKQEAIKMAKSLDIDVILMDVNLTGNTCDGIYLAEEISTFSEARIIMLTMLETTDIICKAFSAGAVNYVTKSNYKEIPSIVRSVYNNSGPIKVLLDDYKRLKKEEQLRKLTPAEIEIYELMEKGYKHAQIREILCKSERTIKNQINSMLKKLGAKNSAEAILKIKRKGI